MWRKSEWRIVGVRGETRIPPGNQLKAWDYILFRPRTQESLRVDENDLDGAIILERKVIPATS